MVTAKIYIPVNATNLNRVATPGTIFRYSINGYKKYYLLVEKNDGEFITVREVFEARKNSVNFFPFVFHELTKKYTFQNFLAEYSNIEY